VDNHNDKQGEDQDESCILRFPKHPAQLVAHKRFQKKLSSLANSPFDASMPIERKFMHIWRVWIVSSDIYIKSKATFQIQITVNFKENKDWKRKLEYISGA
jgi:hypothetical protein